MNNPNFASGPCSKRPGWSLERLEGRRGRTFPPLRAGKGKTGPGHQETQDPRDPRKLSCRHHARLGYGAFEAAMWSLLGARPVTVLVWESFSEGWATDIAKQLKLNPTILRADYGQIPDLNAVNWDHDVVFVANGTTSGVKIPNWDWIPADRKGLSLCDATSAAFRHAHRLVEDGCGHLLLAEMSRRRGRLTGCWSWAPGPWTRLESYDPPWPLPKIFRLKKGGKINRAIFEGDTINTPSLLCVEDYLDALKWADGIGSRRPHSKEPCQPPGRRGVGRQERLDRLSGRIAGDPLQHLGLPLRGQRQGQGASEGGAGEIPQRYRRRTGKKESRLRHGLLQGCASGIPLLVRSHDRPRRISAPPWRNWRRCTGKRSPHL